MPLWRTRIYELQKKKKKNQYLMKCTSENEKNQKENSVIPLTTSSHNVKIPPEEMQAKASPNSGGTQIIFKMLVSATYKNH